jgi:hypothetical protein
MTDSGKCKLARQDATTAEAEARGMMNTASVAQGSTGALLRRGFVTNDAWAWTPGAVLWLSATPGEMTETKPVTGAAIRCAEAFTSKTIYFDPRP